MPEVPPRRSRWTPWRTGFRWFRISILGLILFVLLLLTWLRFAGLPGFVRMRIVSELARRGIAADFRSLHFHWFRGLVAEDLRVSWGGHDGPRFTMAEADLDLAPPPWGGNRQIVRGVGVRRGDLIVPLHLSNAPPRELRIDEVTADIRFLQNDAWRVRRLAARLAGLQLELRGEITNVARLRREREPPDPRAVAHRVELLRNALEELGRWSSPAPPRLEIDLVLDGERPWSPDGDVYLNIPLASSHRGTIHRLRFAFRSHARGELEPARAHGVLEIGELQTPHGGLTDLRASFQTLGSPGPELPTNAIWRADIGHLFLRGLRTRDVTVHGTNHLNPAPLNIRAASLEFLPVQTRMRISAGALGLTPRLPSPTFTGSDFEVDLFADHTFSTAIPVALELRAAASDLHSDTASIDAFSFRSSLTRRESPEPPPESASWWSHAWPLEGDMHFQLTGLQSTNLSIARFELAADWAPPLLRFREIRSELYDGDLRAAGSLDITTGVARLDVDSTFDLHGIDGLLGPRSRANFQRYQWREPPHFTGTVHADLPAWDAPAEAWTEAFRTSVGFDGSFRVGAGSFKNVPFTAAASEIHFDGETWRLPDLRTTRPEGDQRLRVEYHESTQEYRIDARGSVLPHVLKPILGQGSHEILDLFEFTEPVIADVSVWGPWSEGNRQSVAGTVYAANFRFRDQAFDRLDARILYTNDVLRAVSMDLRRGDRRLTAETLAYSFAEDRVWLTNVVNTIAPEIVAAIIHPPLVEKIGPYRFDNPPEIRASGTLVPRDTTTADLLFHVSGGRFRFWRLSTSDIRTRLHWRGESLILTNLSAGFYGGSLTGNAAFNLEIPTNASYRFHAVVRDSDLGALLREAIPGRTNVTEGTFDLDLTVTSAETSDIRTWDGHGSAEVRDGLLWEVPIFGFLSPVLNAVVPGIANNRAEHATTTFTITNGVIHTRDLAILCPPAKLLYRGTIDFDQRVEAKVEGQVLSGLTGVGPIFGFFLRPLTKLLEFKITGTLTDIHAEPLYVPRFLLMPLHPIRTLRELFGSGPDTNAPPHGVTPLEPVPDPSAPPGGFEPPTPR